MSYLSLLLSFETTVLFVLDNQRIFVYFKRVPPEKDVYVFTRYHVPCTMC